MKIEVNEIGGGLTRINVVDGITVPTHVMDDIARDVIRRKQNGDCGTPCTVTSFPQWGHSTCTPSWERPLPTPPTPNREPDGIDVHVDRPQRQNYGGVQWAAENAFRADMKKYRSLEAIAKQCNWPCKEPMKGAPVAQHVAAHANVPQFKPVAPRTTPRPMFGCGCNSEKAALREAIGALAAIVERM